MLLQIRDFIFKEKLVSIQQLSRFFKLDEAALEPMLTLWVNKGVIRPCEAKVGCQARCFRCVTKRATMFYQPV